MAFLFNTRNIKRSRLLLPLSHISSFSFISKSPIILYRNIAWQHNALRRIFEKEQRMKRKDTKKDGKNMMERNQINKKKIFEKSGLKTSKLKEMFNKKKEMSTKKKESEEKLIEDMKQNKYKQALVRQIQLHQTSRLNKRAFLIQMINKKCNPNLQLTNPPSTRKKKLNPEEISLNYDNDSMINYDPDWREKENLPGWLRHRFAMKERTEFKNWRPHKKVNREVMDKIRWLHNKLPEEYNTEKLSSHFKISPESIRRILKSKFIPDSEVIERQEQKYKEKLMKFKEERKEQKKLTKQSKQSTTNQQKKGNKKKI